MSDNVYSEPLIQKVDCATTKAMNKKKSISFKNMIRNIVSSDASSDNNNNVINNATDHVSVKELRRRGFGGGVFSKIDKI